MITTFHHIFFLKKQRNQNTLVPIYLRITVAGKRSEISINRKVEVNNWNPGIGRVKVNNRTDADFNAYLDTVEEKLYQAYHNLLRENKTVSSALLKDEYTGANDQQRMLIPIFQKHNKEMAKLVPNEYSTGTLEKYKTTLSHVVQFLNWKYEKSDIEIRNITPAFISDYDFFLRSIKKCSNNTTVKYVKNFRKIIRICIASGWLNSDPFVMYKSKLKKVETTYLLTEEIQTIANKQFASDRLAQVRDVFMFCCYTGLAYADVKKLKTSQVRKGVDGELWIFIDRQKTNTRSAVPLLPPAAKLLEKYASHNLCINKDVTLPVPSNQKMNDYLKEIATVCGISKKLSSHVARHTFATTITLSNGVPIESVSKMLGHSSLKQTQHYAKILDIKVSLDMQVLRDKLSV